MKDIFKEKNVRKHTMNLTMYGNGMLKTIKRKWYNPFKYLMGEETLKSVEPCKLYTENK